MKLSLSLFAGAGVSEGRPLLVTKIKSKKENKKVMRHCAENVIKNKITTSEEARKRGRNGGIASGKARLKKKFLSQMYADFLIQNHKVKVRKKDVEMTPEEIINMAIIGNLRSYGTSASVAMLKELADRTEGTAGAGGEATKKDADLLGSLLGNSREETEE